MENIYKVSFIKHIKVHWKPITFFGAMFGLYLICVAPDVTWSNGNLDLFDFLFAANTLAVPHAPGLPLYTLLGWAVLGLPGNDAWLLSLFLSLIPSILTCILIFLILKKKVTNPLIPYMGSLVYAGSHIVLSQSTIPEIYSLMTLFIVLAYYLVENGKPKWAVISTSAGLAISYLPGLAFIIFMILYRNYRKKWYWIFSFLPLYFALPFLIREPFISTFRLNGEAIYWFIMYHGQLTFSIPIWELPGRIYEYGQVLLVSFSITLIPIIAGWFKERKLFWLSFPFIVYVLTTLGPLSYWHIMPAVAFMAISAGIGIEAAANKVKLRVNYAVSVICLVSLVLLGVNIYNFDIGRTLDPEPTGARQFLMDLEAVEDNSVIVCWDTCTYAGVYYYNSTTGKNLIGILPVIRPNAGAFPWETEKVKALGLVVPNYTQEEENYIIEAKDPRHLEGIVTEAVAITQIFARHNPNRTVYASVPNSDNRYRREITLVKCS